MQQTGEAALSRKISQKKSVHHFSSLYSSVRDTLISFLETHFPVIVHDASTDTLNDSKQVDNSVVDITNEIYMNNVEVSKIKQSAGQTVESCLKNRDDLIRRTEECELPISALDLLIDQLGGPEHVAEMTGRTWRIVRDKGNTFHVEQRGKGEAEIETINVKECQKFQAGKKLIGLDQYLPPLRAVLIARCRNHFRRCISGNKFTCPQGWGQPEEESPFYARGD